jgi:hypothetical protein
MCSPQFHHPETVDWAAFSFDPSIYVLDYAAMRDQMQPMRDRSSEGRVVCTEPSTIGCFFDSA